MFFFLVEWNPCSRNDGPGGMFHPQAFLFPAKCIEISWFHFGNALGCELQLGRALPHNLCFIYLRQLRLLPVVLICLITAVKSNNNHGLDHTEITLL